MTCRSLTVGAVGILYYLEHQGLFNMYIDLYIYKLYINYIYIYIYIFFFFFGELLSTLSGVKYRIAKVLLSIRYKC